MTKLERIIFTSAHQLKIKNPQPVSAGRVRHGYLIQIETNLKIPIFLAYIVV